jgi:hypothetical protein
MEPGALGRRIPTSWEHVSKYPLRLMAAPPVPPITVERVLSLPAYRRELDQGTEGACTGFGSTWMMAILNRRLYHARQLYLEAQKIDEWDDTPPQEGSSVRAVMDVLRTRGHWRRVNGTNFAPIPDARHGISENRWATKVDEIRACIAAGVPVTGGFNWYTAFDSEGIQKIGMDYWIGRGGDLGPIRGGHCICIYGASDRRQAVKIVNNWGVTYPLVWLPYTVLRRLLKEDGEASIVTDRI